MRRFIDWLRWQKITGQIFWWEFLDWFWGTHYVEEMADEVKLYNDMLEMRLKRIK